MCIGSLYAAPRYRLPCPRQAAHNITLYSLQQKEVFHLSPAADYDAAMPTAVLSRTVNIHGFYRGFSLRVPKENAAETLAAIDNMSIFIGNKLFYYTRDDIAGWETGEQGGFLLYNLPPITYTKYSLLKNWTNYYGDFNLAVLGITDFFLHPGRYAPVWFFLLCLFFIFRLPLGRI